MNHAIRVAVASGKGGTGKTTVATNLATIMAEQCGPTAYVDCDVEEPNGHLFLRPLIERQHPVTTPVPEIDQSRCTFCGACARACRFSALLTLPDQVLTFPELCHGCGGCALACPEAAIREVPRAVGSVTEGTAGRLAFRQGTLNVGETLAPTVIRAALDSAPAGHTLVLDAPPGTSCPVIETVRGADVVLLVTEPTPFGLHDLELAVATVRELGLPFGVAINRVGIGDRKVYEYCLTQDIPVLLELPNDRRVAEAYSRGQLAAQALPDLSTLFSRLASRLRHLADSSFRTSTGLPPEPAPRLSRHPSRGQPPAVEPPVVEPTAVEPTAVEPTDVADAGPVSGRPPTAAGRQVRELIVISGKGGTGKTSVTASFLALAQAAVPGQRSGPDRTLTMADCDVDAPDLDLVLRPTPRARHPFSGGEVAVINHDLCLDCGMCAEHCRFDAIRHDATGLTYAIDPLACEGCGVCASVCPELAIQMHPAESGEWLVSDTRYGPMVHARLNPAQGNSGKLVSLVRSEARAIATGEDTNAGTSTSGSDILICDGPPGVGCPAIASVTGARMALIITEPTLSGLHDLRRAAELTRQFGVVTGVCVNKCDINPEMTRQLAAEARELGLLVLGQIRYDESVTTAQLRKMPVVEVSDGPAAADIRALWRKVVEVLDSDEDQCGSQQYRSMQL